MKSWLRRIRGAAGMALVWAVTWAAVGALKAMLVDPIGTLGTLWLGPPIGVFPGFVGGLLFSALLAIAAGDRRLEDLSVREAGGWGALVGFGLGSLPIVINQPPPQHPAWLVAAVVVGSMSLLGALSAAGSLALARWSAPRQGTTPRSAVG